MITLNYNPKDELEEDFLRDIEILTFDNDKEMFVFLCAELHPDDECVYILAIGDKPDSVIYIDHVTGHILGMLNFMMDGITEEQVFLFVEKTYEDAYKLATDMKEETGLAYGWQKEGNERETASKQVISLGLSNKN